MVREDVEVSGQGCGEYTTLFIALRRRLFSLLCF